VRGFRQQRFAPRGWPLVALEALVGAASYVLGMGLRFVDDPSGAQVYAPRTLPWAVAGALVAVGCGELARRLRRPGSPLAARPVLPYVLSGLATLALVVGVNKLLPVGWTLPASVAVMGSLLAGAGVAALQIASSRTPLAVEDLLPRRSVRLDVAGCAPAIRGRRVLITGAAGSIGWELARQVLQLGPAQLTLLDVNESGLYDLDGALAPLRGPTAMRLVMADVADADHVGRVFRAEQPDVVFHAAAYKHVPLVEANPDQGFACNVLGTLAVCEAAVAAGAERVVVISTDKAVEATSVMGLTKRLAELIVAALGQRDATTVFSAVRFVNVLGSRGSVVPTLLRQIDAGGPVTITDPEAHRFFMTVPEAASLVLRCAALDEGGIFVLDTGDELRIVDLAERLVRLQGLRPGRDIAFRYIGLRPGERLRERLVGAGERLVATDHAHVRRVEAAYGVDAERVLQGVRDLADQRRVGVLAPAGYAPALRALIEASTQPTQPSLA
jgi:FlaA1/EpsC-like NDP-sugar epimerase